MNAQSQSFVVPRPTVIAILIAALAFLCGSGVRAGERADADRVLEAFLGTASIDELLGLVADRNAVEQDIRAHYEDGVRKPVGVDEISHASVGKIPGTNLDVHLYLVRVGRTQIPVSVEETEGGFKVDWTSFNQFSDRKLEKFFSDPKKLGGDFLVQLRRSHYFGNAVPNADELVCFRVQSPIAPFLDAFAFVEKDSEFADEMLKQFRWSESYRPVVALKWVDPPAGEGEPRIEIVRLVRSKWRQK